MNSLLREKAIKLRLKENLSYSEIRKRLNVPKSTLSYWLREYPLSEARIKELKRKGWKKGEASREKFRLSMRKKREAKDKEVYEVYRKKFANLPNNSLLVAGLMLYLGEGDKRRYERICLANTDIKIIKFFIKWLDEFLGIRREKIRLELHLHEGMNKEKEESFWRKELGLLKKQFYKSQVRKSRKGTYSYKESFRHGTCGIYVMGVEKKRELTMAIKAFVDSYLE